MPAFVYLLTNRPHGVLYAGVTTDLVRRISEHRDGLADGFTRKYRIKSLVWFETHDALADARARERSIKRWRRAWKIALIESVNPDWRDLAFSLND